MYPISEAVGPMKPRKGLTLVLGKKKMRVDKPQFPIDFNPSIH
jgi:hypothetical protein